MTQNSIITEMLDGVDLSTVESRRAAWIRLLESGKLQQGSGALKQTGPSDGHRPILLPGGGM